MNGTSLATLEEVLLRLERLEMATALIASVVTRQQVPSQIGAQLQQFVAQITAERTARESPSGSEEG